MPNFQIAKHGLHSPSFLFLFTLMLCLSCSESKNSEEQRASAEPTEPKRQVTIVDKGIKTFTLDHEANFQNLSSLKLSQVDGVDYMTFYDRNAHAIYMYDYQTEKLFKKIKLEKDGPNKVQTHLREGYFFHTMDSIFFNGTPHGIYLINSEGDVIQKKTLSKVQRTGKFAGYASYDALRLIFDGGSRFQDGEIEAGFGIGLGEEKEYERVIFDYEKDTITKKYIKTGSIVNNYPEVLRIKKERKKRGNFSFTLSRYFSSNENYLYASTAISDSLYVFEGDKLIKTIYAGVPSIEVADYATYATIRGIKHFKNGMEAVENPKQPAQFKNTLMSPDGKFIYRVLYHGTKPKMVNDSEKPIPYVFGATLIVVDLETSELSYYDLPVDEIELAIPLNKNLFASNDGILLRVKHQENEDQVQFRHFSIVK